MKIAVIIFTIFFVAIMAVATFWDFQISKALCLPNNIFFEIISYLGAFVSYLAVGISLSVFFAVRYKKNNVLWKVIFAVLVVVSNIVLIPNLDFNDNVAGMFRRYALVPDNCVDYFSLPYYITPILVLFSPILSALELFIIWKIFKNRDIKKFVYIALFCVAMLAVTQICVQTLKLIWGRARFMWLEDESEFTTWFISNVHDHSGDRFASFPSGHTASACVMFFLALLPSLFNTVKHKWVYYTVPVIFVILVAVSRIVLGMHFLSDITVGFAIGFYTFVILRKAIPNK